MELILAESPGAVLRWLHVIAGIAWIGSSFYFIHLDLSLKPRPELPADVKGDEMRRVALPPESPRGGVLTQGTVLAVTSNPDRTSPVKRGKWVLENILGAAPPPPPPSF